jgi:hypothetical protein
MNRYICIHGHFYQPPREDPATGLVPREPSAAPFHDWNQRIADESYRPVAAARLLDDHGQVLRRTNLYAWCSFDVGPTLAVWLERYAPDVLAAMYAGDAASAERLGGHGNAMAHPYHHIILPLASRRDKVSEVRWGMADFRARFQREPEGMWLPETAVDEETLDVLAQEGIRFTVLAPHQLAGPGPAGAPLRWRGGGGRQLALMPYDGALAAAVAFGDLLRDGDRLAAHLAPPGASGLRAVATDGETFGHHHKFGEMALARALDTLAQRDDVRVTNYAAYLAQHAVLLDGQLLGPSSWSCAHGVERWRADCGCALDRAQWPSQAWRTPLREAVDWLAEALHAGADHRDETLLRAINRMYTSCAWFFDDLGRIEVDIILRFARWAMEWAGRRDELEPEFLRRLSAARSSDPAVGDGADVYRRATAAEPS